MSCIFQTKNGCFATYLLIEICFFHSFSSFWPYFEAKKGDLVTSNENHQIIILFNIIEIFKKKINIIFIMIS